MISGFVTDALETVQAWFLAKLDWVIDPLWIWYGWGGIAVAIALVVAVFVPFKWIRAGLGFVLLLIGAYIAGGRHMAQIKAAEIAKLRAARKKAVAPPKDTGWKW